MSLFRQVARGIRALLRPDQADAEVAAEVADYAERTAADHAARGLSAEAARRAAFLEMGAAVSVREEVRSSGWEHGIDTALQDIRYALRGLRRNPTFTLAVVATLALGIGTSTAVYSALRPILLDPLPFPQADRLVTLDDRSVDGTPVPSTLGTFAEVRARSRAFETLAAADQWKPSLTGAGDPEQLQGQAVTAAYFRVFGAAPLRGRDFSAEDDLPGAPPVVIVSRGLAERRFGGAESTVGRTIQLDGNQVLVVGVMPADFVNVLAPAVDIWRPLREQATADFNTRSWGHHYQIVGRLAPAQSPLDAASELGTIGSAPLPEFPRPSWADLAQGMVVRPLQEVVVGSIRPALLAIAAAVLLLLAIASVNVANLLLARGAQRHAEFAMRLALGAGRTRLLRQLLTESVALALLGGVLGLGVATICVRVFVAVSPPGLPRVEAIQLDGSVFVFALALTAVIGILVGLLPALGAIRSGVGAGLQRQSRRATAGPGGLRRGLVVSEVALAIVLLVVSGLLFQSERRLMRVATGFEPAQVVTLQVVATGPGFDSDAARLRFFAQALEQVRQVPGVTSAAFTSLLPLSGDIDGYGFEAQSLPDLEAGEAGSAMRYAVTPDYFATMQVPLVRGRLLEASDRQDSPATVVINASLAKRLFGNRDPIGQQMRFGPSVGSDEPWRQVVGVVGDVRQVSLASAVPDAFYVANSQWNWADRVATLVVRASGEPSALIPGLERAIWDANPNVPIPRVETMTGYVVATASDRQFVLLILETFAAAALLLAAVGLYGVISGSVTERHREIGIRTALGATPANVVGTVVRDALGLALVGAGIGLVGAAAATRLVTSMLFGVSSLDPFTYGTAVVLLTVVAVLAAWVPARRAARVDPVLALRTE